MTWKTKPGRLTQALLETVDDMRRVWVMDEATHQEITVRHLGANAASQAVPINAEDIRAMRENAHISQAVFARYLNLTAGYVS